MIKLRNYYNDDMNNNRFSVFYFLHQKVHRFYKRETTGRA